METATTPPRRPEPDKTASCPLGCPMCGGRLEAAAGALRCMRCKFALCEGCEGGPAAD
jgi:hypothetical protein